MALKHLRDPFLAVVVLCLALIPVMASASLMSGDVWRSGSKSLSTDPGQVAPSSYSILLTMEEGDVIWVDYEPERLTCSIENTTDEVVLEYLDSDEHYEIPEDGIYTLTFQTETKARLDYEVHKEGYNQGGHIIYLTPLPIVGAVAVFIYWHLKGEKDDYKPQKVSGKEEAFDWKGPWGLEPKRGNGSEYEGSRWSFLVVPISTLPMSFITYYFWQDIYSVFLIIGESPLAVCCGWVLLVPVTAFLSGSLVSTTDEMFGPESWGGFTGALIGCGFATAAHLVVTSAGAPLLISGIYAVMGIFYLTLVICYQVSK